MRDLIREEIENLSKEIIENNPNTEESGYYEKLMD